VPSNRGESAVNFQTQADLLNVVDSRRAASRADCTAGSRSPIMIPMIAMTTKSSTKLNAGFRYAMAIPLN
jgi:hypothetical protein